MQEAPRVRKPGEAISIAVVRVATPGPLILRLTRNIDANTNDANPMVVANAIQALGEIHESAPELNAFDINGQIHTKLLVALNECTE